MGAQLAIPAPFDYETGISGMKHKLPYLYGVDLRKELAARFCWQPEQVRFIHDASAFLLGEITSGAARGAFRAAGITLGTGIGSGFSLSGRLLTHGFGIPPGGEIWNLPFNGGIVEDILSARAIQREYQRRTGVNREVTSLAAAAPGDAAARETFAEFGRFSGRHCGRLFRISRPTWWCWGRHFPRGSAVSSRRAARTGRPPLSSGGFSHAGLRRSGRRRGRVVQSWQCRSSIRPRIRFRHGAKRWCLELSLSSRACVQAVGGAPAQLCSGCRGPDPLEQATRNRATAQNWAALGGWLAGDTSSLRGPACFRPAASEIHLSAEL